MGHLSSSAEGREIALQALESLHRKCKIGVLVAECDPDHLPENAYVCRSMNPPPTPHTSGRPFVRNAVLKRLR